MKTHVFALRLSAVFAFALVAAPLAAVDVQLAAVQFPEAKSVDLDFVATSRVAPAQAEAEVAFKNGQARVEISYKKLPPAILFAGDVTSYVVWAVARDGAIENLGELIVRKQSGDAEYRTGQKEFGLMITAEPYPAVLKPSELVVFTSVAPPPKKFKSTPVTLSAFAPAPRLGNPDDRQHGLLRDRVARPHPGPERPPAGAADGGREVRAGRRAGRLHHPRAGDQLLQGRQGQARPRLRAPEPLPVLRRDPHDAAEARRRGRRGRRGPPRRRDAVARAAADPGAEAGRGRPATDPRRPRAGRGGAGAGGRRPAAAGPGAAAGRGGAAADDAAPAAGAGRAAGGRRRAGARGRRRAVGRGRRRRASRRRCRPAARPSPSPSRRAPPRRRPRRRRPRSPRPPPRSRPRSSSSKPASARPRRRTRGCAPSATTSRGA